jgi:quercetin dioxygenase-like cupin family protein
MISRRFFAGCALCVAGLKATNVTAQTPGLVRTQLNRIEEPGDKLATVQMLVDIDANFYVPPHTHPGVETAYILEGGGVFQMRGAAERQVGPGDTFQVPSETTHALKAGPKKTKVLSIYVVDKSKPLASPSSF